MTMTERAAPDILTCQSDGHSVRENAGEGELLRCGPVDCAFCGIVQDRLAFLAPAFELLVKRESRRRCLQPFVDLAQPLEWDRGFRTRRRTWRRRFRHWRLEIFLWLQRGKRLLQLRV